LDNRGQIISRGGKKSGRTERRGGNLPVSSMEVRQALKESRWRDEMYTKKQEEVNFYLREKNRGKEKGGRLKARILSSAGENPDRKRREEYR